MAHLLSHTKFVYGLIVAYVYSNAFNLYFCKYNLLLPVSSLFLEKVIGYTVAVGGILA